MLRVTAAGLKQNRVIGAHEEKHILNALRWKVARNAASEEVLPPFLHSSLNDASENVHF